MSSAEVTKEKVLPHNGEWSLADIRAHLPEKDQYWSDRALRRICDAYDQLTQRLEELERELAEFKQECAYIHECDLKELAEAKAALHTTRIIPGTEELHKQLTEAKAEIASQKKHYENLFDKFQATKEMQLADVRAEIERLREEIMSTPFL